MAEVRLEVLEEVVGVEVEGMVLGTEESGIASTSGKTSVVVEFFVIDSNEPESSSRNIKLLSSSSLFVHRPAYFLKR